MSVVSKFGYTNHHVWAPSNVFQVLEVGADRGNLLVKFTGDSKAKWLSDGCLYSPGEMLHLFDDHAEAKINQAEAMETYKNRVEAREQRQKEREEKEAAVRESIRHNKWWRRLYRFTQRQLGRAFEG
jgi:hypothetical protein